MVAIYMYIILIYLDSFMVTLQSRIIHLQAYQIEDKNRAVKKRTWGTRSLRST